MRGGLKVVLPILAVIAVAVGTSVARHQDGALRDRSSDEGNLGTAYALGSPNHELAVTVESARLTLRYALAEEELLATAGERLLVLRLTLANPRETTQRVSSAGFRIGWMTTEGGDVADALTLYGADGGAPLDLTLGAGRRVQVDAVLTLPTEGALQTVWVQRGPSTVRYRMTGVVPKLVDVFASPDGSTATDEAFTRFGEVFSIGAFDWKVRSLTPSVGGSSRVDEDSEDEDEITFVADVAVRNAVRRELPFSWNQLTARLVDTLGNEYRWDSALTDSRGETVDVDLAPGSSSGFRLVFHGSREAEPALLILEEDQTKRRIQIRLRPDRKPVNAPGR